MSESLILGIVTAVIGLAGTVFAGVMAFLMARLNAKSAEAAKKVDAAAVKVDAVKVALETTTASTTNKLDGIAKTGEAVHTLVNNAMGVQLKLNAVMARRLASVTREAGDVAAADLAEKLFDEHMKKQAVVDTMHSPGDTP